MFDHYFCFFSILFGMEMAKSDELQSAFAVMEIDDVQAIISSWVDDFLRSDYDDAEEFFNDTFNRWWNDPDRDIP